jgi:hypothetical protein
VATTSRPPPKHSGKFARLALRRHDWLPRPGGCAVRSGKFGPRPSATSPKPTRTIQSLDLFWIVRRRPQQGSRSATRPGPRLLFDLVPTHAVSCSPPRRRLASTTLWCRGACSQWVMVPARPRFDPLATLRSTARRPHGHARPFPTSRTRVRSFRRRISGIGELKSSEAIVGRSPTARLR